MLTNKKNPMFTRNGYKLLTQQHCLLSYFSDSFDSRAINAVRVVGNGRRPI